MRSGRGRDLCVDEQGEKTGVEVAVKGGRPVALIKDLDELAAKKVRSVLHSREGLTLPQIDVLALIMLGEGVYRLRIADCRLGDDAPVEASRLMPESESVKQVLYEWPSGLLDQHCELIWAGDLDGDGKVDLFMSLSGHYKVVEYPLFLSSRRFQGNLVQRVAALQRVGC